jgi:4-hydroxybenzoate polyprenyltransferase
MNKVRKFEHQGRFAVISEYRTHIIAYAIIGGLACIYTYFGFSFSRMKLLLLAGIISVLYTLPVFGKSMRLRDFSFVKIFLIAFVWAIVTESIPLYEAGISFKVILPLFLERVLFFIAITIPFDIRDIEVDKTNHVKTIPSVLGKHNSIVLAICLLLFCNVIEIYLSYNNNHFSGFNSAITAYVITGILIYIIKDKSDDYYFSGLMDGTIMLPLVLLQFLN